MKTDQDELDYLKNNRNDNQLDKIYKLQ